MGAPYREAGRFDRAMTRAAADGLVGHGADDRLAGGLRRCHGGQPR